MALLDCQLLIERRFPQSFLRYDHTVIDQFANVLLMSLLSNCWFGWWCQEWCHVIICVPEVSWFWRQCFPLGSWNYPGTKSICLECLSIGLEYELFP
jgi:hypothetical protein